MAHRVAREEVSDAIDAERSAIPAIVVGSDRDIAERVEHSAVTEIQAVAAVAVGLDVAGGRGVDGRSEIPARESDVAVAGARAGLEIDLPILDLGNGGVEPDGAA